MTGVKDVTLEPTPKRRSVRAGVKELEARLTVKREELAEAERHLDKAEAAQRALWNEVAALTDAYNLVKPQPRARKVKA